MGPEGLRLEQAVCHALPHRRREASPRRKMARGVKQHRQGIASVETSCQRAMTSAFRSTAAALHDERARGALREPRGQIYLPPQFASPSHFARQALQLSVR
jgi:hypothetical protein